MAKRTAGTAVLCGALLVSSAGIAGSANAAGPGDGAPAALDLEELPQKLDDPKRADVKLTLSQEGEQLVVTLENKGPNTTPAMRLQVSSHGEGVTFPPNPPSNCTLQGGGMGYTCGLEPLSSGASSQVRSQYTLKGKNPAVGASVKFDGSSVIDGNLKNNSDQLTLKAKPTPKPKPSSKPPKPEPSKPPKPKPSSKPPKPKPSSKPPKPSKPPKKPECKAAVIEYSKDNGKTWTRSRLLQGFPGKLKVRVAGPIAKGCPYKVSLASYSAEGPTWKTSGKQAFLGMDTVTLTSKKPTGDLDISKKLPKCFGQVDLYGNGNKYDGKKYPLPNHDKGDNVPNNMIAGWNGGKACTPKPPTTSPKPSTSPSKSPSASPSASNTPSATPSTTPTESTKPPQSPTPTPTPTETPSEKPTPTPTPTPTTTPTETPVETPSASPTPSQPAPPPAPEQGAPQAPEVPDGDQRPTAEEEPTVPATLPKTGANSRLPYLAAMAVFSVLLGALALWWTNGSQGRAPKLLGATPSTAGRTKPKDNPWTRR